MRRLLRFLPVLAVLILVGAPVRSQDSIRLKNGDQVLGEVVEETGDSLIVVTRNCELRTIPRAEIERERRGQKLQKRSLERLATIDPRDAAALWGIVKELDQVKALHRDAERLARRAVAYDAELEAPRLFLGQVRFRGVWYADKDAASKALTEILTGEGLVPAAGGWVKAEQAAALAASPKDFMLIDELIWRSIAEVMVERGFTNWKGEWYSAEEKPLLALVEKLEQRTGEVAHVAHDGSATVVTVTGREDAQTMARDITKARNWFCQTFEIGPGSRAELRALENAPPSIHYVLTDQAALEKFCETYRKELRFDEEALKLSLPQKHALWSDMGHVIHTGEMQWRYYLVSQMGGTLLSWFWHGGFPLPDWLWVAAAHHAEIAVYGDARTQYIALDRYARTTEIPAATRRQLESARSAVRELYSRGEAPALRALYFKHFNELTPADDLTGLVLFQYFLTERKPAFLKYLAEKSGGTIHERFDRCFKKRLEEEEHDFKEWLAKDG